MHTGFPLGNLSFLHTLKPLSYREPGVRVAPQTDASRNAPSSWPPRLFYQQGTDSKVHTIFCFSRGNLNVEKRNTIRVRPWWTCIAMVFGSPLDFRKPDAHSAWVKGPQKQMNRMPVWSCFSWGCVSEDNLGCQLQTSSPKQEKLMLRKDRMTLFLSRIGIASG